MSTRVPPPPSAATMAVSALLVLVFATAACGGNEDAPLASDTKSPRHSPREHLYVTTVATIPSEYVLDAALDREGNLLVSGAGEVWRIGPGGEVEKLAGRPADPGGEWWEVRDGSVDEALLPGPHGVALDGEGNLWFTDSFSNRVRRITPQGLVATVAGGGDPDHSRTYEGGYQDGAGPDARFDYPSGIAFDERNQKLIVADTGNQRIRAITLVGEVSTVAGDGLLLDDDRDGYWDKDDGPAESASFFVPRNVAVGGDGTVYVINRRGNIRKVDSGGTVSTILKGIQGLEARLNSPRPDTAFRGILVDSDGTIYFTGYDYIATVTPQGHVTILAGMGEPPTADTEYRPGYRDGFALDSRFWCPGGIALDTDGSLLVVDACNSVVRRIAPIDQDLLEARSQCEEESAVDTAHLFSQLVRPHAIPDTARSGFEVDDVIAAADLVVTASFVGVRGFATSSEGSSMMLSVAVEDVLHGPQPPSDTLAVLLAVNDELLEDAFSPDAPLSDALPPGRSLLALRMLDDWGREGGLRWRDEAGGPFPTDLHPVFMAIPEGTWLETATGGFVGVPYPAEFARGAPCLFDDFAEKFRAR